MIALSNFFQNQIASKQGVEWFRKLIIQNLKGTEDIDLSSFITGWGTISRKLQYETGKFSPGGHSFTIQDSKDLGKFLFTLGQEFGTEFWMDKEYTIDFGFLNEQTEDTIDVGTFKINSKGEDRIGGSISISSQDNIKELSDFKVCTTIDARDVFDYDSSSFDDTRGFQEVIKYGTHKLVINGNDKKQLKQRDNPFSITVGFPNLDTGDVEGSSAGHTKNHVWYFPFQNSIDKTSSLYENGAVKIYFWDYIDDRWVAFAGSEVTDLDITVETVSGVDGIYVTIEDPDNVTTFTGDSFTEYVNGTGTHFNQDDEDERDVAIAIETIDNLQDGSSDHDPNPARIIKDLLTNSRFINFASTVLDLSDLDNPNLDFSFDRTYNFLDNSNAVINTNFVKEVSLLKIIESIIGVSAMFFYSVPKRSGADKRFKLQIQQPFNPCTDKPVSSLNFSTKDYIGSLDIKTSSDTQVDQVKVTNFDSSKSSKDSFDLKRTPVPAATKGRILQFGTESNPNVYWFNSSGIAGAIASRYLNWFKEPIELYNIGVGKSGVSTEIFDFIQVHDSKSDVTKNVQIYETKLPIGNGNVSLVGKRFEQLFNPDVDEPLKKWAFVTAGGTHTGSNNSANLVDSTAKFQTWKVKIGDTIRNDTDGSEGAVNSIVSETELAVSLSGGTDNDFDTSDVYYLGVECASFVTANVAPNGKVTDPHTGESWHTF